MNFIGYVLVCVCVFVCVSQLTTPAGRLLCTNNYAVRMSMGRVRLSTSSLGSLGDMRKTLGCGRKVAISRRLGDMQEVDSSASLACGQGRNLMKGKTSHYSGRDVIWGQSGDNIAVTLVSLLVGWLDGRQRCAVGSWRSTWLFPFLLSQMLWSSVHTVTNVYGSHSC
jgi:hypothetical protein